MKLLYIWTSGSGDVILRYFLSRVLALFGGVEQFGHFWKRDISEIILNLDMWFRRCSFKGDILKF